MDKKGLENFKKLFTIALLPVMISGVLIQLKNSNEGIASIICAGIIILWLA